MKYKGWKQFGAILTPSFMMQTSAKWEIFDCPICGALIPRDRIVKHERWHNNNEGDLANESK